MNPFRFAPKWVRECVNAITGPIPSLLSNGDPTLGYDTREQRRRCEPTDEQWEAYATEEALVEAEEESEVHEPQPWAVALDLSPEQRDRRWRSKHGQEWWFENGRWWHRAQGDSIQVGTPLGYAPRGDGPYTEIAEMPKLDWQGWAVPAVLEVLAEAAPTWSTDYDDWCETVAPLIADRIACDPQRAIEALKNDKVNG